MIIRLGYDLERKAYENPTYLTNETSTDINDGSVPWQKTFMFNWTPHKGDITYEYDRLIQRSDAIQENARIMLRAYAKPR